MGYIYYCSKDGQREGVTEQLGVKIHYKDQHEWLHYREQDRLIII
jgi:hypothetical protein